MDFEDVGALPGPPLNVFFYSPVLLELAAALVLERQQPGTRALRVRADAPVGTERPLQLQEVPASTRAVRPPILLAAPLAPGLEVRGQVDAERVQQLMEPVVFFARHFPVRQFIAHLITLME